VQAAACRDGVDQGLQRRPELVLASQHGEAMVIPLQAWVGGLAATVIIGALAGLLPAIRAARLSPTQALWTV